MRVEFKVRVECRVECRVEVKCRVEITCRVEVESTGEVESRPELECKARDEFLSISDVTVVYALSQYSHFEEYMNLECITKSFLSKSTRKIHIATMNAERSIPYRWSFEKNHDKRINSGVAISWRVRNNIRVTASARTPITDRSAMRS